MNYGMVSKVRRFVELDALRGVAALVVVLHHFNHMRLGKYAATLWPRLLYPLIAGHEGVILFFALSGFVLALPYFKGTNLPYNIFLIRRITRIYFPYLAALVLAVTGAFLWHGRFTGDYWVTQTWSSPISWRLVLRHVILIRHYDTNQYNTAFWTLVQEMRISIIFPLIFFATARFRTDITLTATFICLFGAKALAIRLHVYPTVSALLDDVQYVQIFIFGILLAKNCESLCARYKDLRVPTRLLITLAFLITFFGGHHIYTSINLRMRVLMDPLVASGAAGIIIVSISSMRIGVALRSSVLQFLGRISYSLYLVHATVLWALTAVIGARVSTSVFFPIYLILAIGSSAVFCFCVEEPCMRLGNKFLTLRRFLEPNSRICHSLVDSKQGH